METPIASLVEAHFQEMGFRYYVDRESPAGPKFTLALGLQNGLVQMVATCLEAESALTVTFQTSVCSPAAALDEMAFLIARLNQGLRLGRFELDVDRGYVCFTAGLEFGSSEPQAGMLLPLFAGGSCILDDALPALNAVAYGQMPAKAAAEMADRVEKEEAPESLEDPEFIDLMERLMGEEEIDDLPTGDGGPWADWEDVSGQPGLFGDDPAA